MILLAFLDEDGTFDVKGFEHIVELLVLAQDAIVAAPLRQTRRMVAGRSAADLSAVWMMRYAGGCVVWLVYGINIGSTPLARRQPGAGARGHRHGARRRPALSRSNRAASQTPGAVPAPPFIVRSP